MSLDFSQVTFGYDAQPVISDFNLSVPNGGITVLAGATGSGKSTVLKLAAGLLRPKTGAVTVDNSPIWRRSLLGHCRRDPDLPWRLGYVMQRPERQLFAPTVLDDVAFGPKNAGLTAQEAASAARKALELLEVSHLACRSPFELSGGQQRLVAIAGVLAMKPRNLVLDEPLSALDPQGRNLVERALTQLATPTGALLMVCHDMDAAGRIASQMVVLDQGAVALEGPCAQVFSHAEKLHRLGLGIPAPLAFAHRLEARTGASVGAPLTEEALVAAILAQRDRIPGARQDRTSGTCHASRGADSAKATANEATSSDSEGAPSRLSGSVTP